MRIFFIAFTGFLFSLNCSAQFVGLSTPEIKALKRLIKTNTEVAKMYVRLQSHADNALKDAPAPRDTIISEGHLNTHPDKIASIKAMEDYQKIYALAIAYKVSRKNKYLKKAVEYLKAWAAINQPQGNPINDSKLDELFEGYDMLRTKIRVADRDAVDAWLDKIAGLEIKKVAKGKSTSMNNWHSHRLKVVGAIGYILNKAQYKQYATDGLKQQIGINLNADGTSWDFLERDALHYHAYDLEPMLYLAIIIKRATGNDDFNYTAPNGASIKKSVDWFVPYISGQKAHEEFNSSKVAFDLARAKNNEKGYAAGTLFDPLNGVYTLSLASFFDLQYLDTVRLAIHTQRDYPNWQALLNDIMAR